MTLIWVDCGCSIRRALLRDRVKVIVELCPAHAADRRVQDLLQKLEAVCGEPPAAAEEGEGDGAD